MDFSLLALLAAVAACGSKGASSKPPGTNAPSDLKVVVEADRTHLLQERQNLLSRNQEVEKERALLQAARANVAEELATAKSGDAAARNRVQAGAQMLNRDADKLQRKAQELETERAKLDAAQADLLARMAKLTDSGGSGMPIEAREAAMAQRELEVTRREVRVAKVEAAEVAGLQQVAHILRGGRDAGANATAMASLDAADTGDAAVLKALQDKSHELAPCYRKRGHGKVDVSVTVAPDGHVKAARAQSASGDSNDVGRCVAARIKAWRLGKRAPSTQNEPKADVRVVLPVAWGKP